MSSTQTLSSRIIELKGAIFGLNFSIIFLLVMTTAYVVIRGLDLFLYLYQWKKEKDKLKNKDSSKKSKKRKDGLKKSSKNGSTKKSKKKGKKPKTTSSKASSTLSSTKTKSTENDTSKSTKSGASTKTLTTTKSIKNYKKNEPAKKKTLFDFGKKHENERASQDVDRIEKRKKTRERKIKKRLCQPKSDPFEENRKQLAKNTVDQIPT